MGGDSLKRAGGDGILYLSLQWWSVQYIWRARSRVDATGVQIKPILIYMYRTIILSDVYSYPLSILVCISEFLLA